jgi:hypothetical protein
MSTQSNYTPEEWKTISNAPLLAGLLVSVSDLSGPIGMLKEAVSVVKSVTETAGTTSNELIRSVAQKIKGSGGRPDLPDLPKDRSAVGAMLIDHCKRAVELVAQKSPEEAEEYKRWIVSIARKTAEASREGGFLGIGGTLVSEEESSALNALAKELGLSARSV